MPNQQDSLVVPHTKPLMLATVPSGLTWQPDCAEQFALPVGPK